jgi:hypothetical protein
MLAMPNGETIGYNAMMPDAARLAVGKSVKRFSGDSGCPGGSASVQAIAIAESRAAVVLRPRSARPKQFIEKPH